MNLYNYNLFKSKIIKSCLYIDVFILFQYGDTPLHTSARYGHAGVLRILISAECKVSEQNKVSTYMEIYIYF